MSLPSWPYAAMSPAMAIRFALKWQVAGLLLMAAHVLLVKQSIWLFPLIILAVGWLYVHAPLAGLIVYLQILIYQNWIIGLLMDGMEREPTFVVLQGTNFAALVMIASLAWFRLMSPTWRDLRPILIAVAIALVAAVIYGGIGASKEGITSASIYFRSSTALVFAVLVGLDLGRIYSYRTIAIGFLVSAGLSMLLGYVEIAIPEVYYEATNAVQFMAIKTINDPKFDVFYSTRDILIHNEVVLFNVSGSDSGIIQIRFMGTIMHPISYAYIIAAVALVAWSINYSGCLFAVLPLLLLTGAKGANLLFICSIILWYIWSATRSRALLALAGLVMMIGYVGFGLIFGEEKGDYHVLGFLGGFHSLMTVPWGHGIGVGGNLSRVAGAGFKWQEFQQQGGADFALESAVGVLFYQMGAAAITVFAVFAVLFKMAPWHLPARGRISHRHSMMFIVLATVAANGVFQEEAYAPTAAGLVTMFCAIIIANGFRSVIQLEPERPMLRTVHV